MWKKCPQCCQQIDYTGNFTKEKKQEKKQPSVRLWGHPQGEAAAVTLWES